MSDNRGGIRKNAGRKRIPSENKKVSVQMYIPPKLAELIDRTEIINHNSLSKKCLYLVNQGLKQFKAKNKGVVRFIDLFAGIGGTRIGFNQALQLNGLKGKCVFTSEIKKSAIKVYKDNFKYVNLYGNIKKVDPMKIPDFDYLLGGFPCQSFSTAGKGLGFEDARGTLFFNIAKILKYRRPKGFLLENVSNLLHHDHGHTFQVIYNILRNLGYSVGYSVLPGRDFGLAQNRKRIYIIGTRNKQKDSLDPYVINMSGIDRYNDNVHFGDVIDTSKGPRKDKFSKKLMSHYSLHDVIGKKINDKRGGKNNIHSWDFWLRGKVTLKESKLLDALLKERRKHKWAKEYGIKWMDGMPLTFNMIKTFFDDVDLKTMLKDLVKKGYLKYEYPKKAIGHRRVYDTNLPKGYNIVTGKLSFEYTKILDPKGFTPTLVATDMSRLGVPVKGGIRPLDKREGLRLFGFPDWFSLKSVSINKAYDLLGNTVCVPVIRAVANRLLNS